MFCVSQAIQLLEEEDLRSRRYLHSSSYKLVKKEMEGRLSSDHIDMLHGECEGLVQRESCAGKDISLPTQSPMDQ